jgi:DNA topoisomerase-3
MSICQPVMVRESFKQIYRAVFSSLTKSDLRLAFKALHRGPNHNESISVDARQIIDLKVGVAFSRFQTLYFRRTYAGLKEQLVTYGPCQTPTLAFCVKRKAEIDAFTPRSYWKCYGAIEINGNHMRLSHDAEKSWKIGEAENRKVNLMKRPDGQLIEVKSKDNPKERPKGLNTVEMLKHASSVLGMGPHDAMKTAERLYLSGYMTYPRTESTAYPKTFDFRSVVQAIENFHYHKDIKKYANGLLAIGVAAPKKGVDQGDHPPITPTNKIPSYNDLSGGESYLYDFVVRNFLATISTDAKLKNTKAKFKFGNDSFTLEGVTVVHRGFLEIATWSAVATKTIPELVEGTNVSLQSVDIEEGQTEAPDFLTESELITLMEKNGIGTDASMATHINNICERHFVTVSGQKRRLVPSVLGIAMISTYNEIDKELAGPHLRKNIEDWVNEIANGNIFGSLV